MKNNKIIEINHASVLRGNKKILNDVSFSIESKGHTVILGPNGSGKSTLLKLLTKELYPVSDKNTYIKLFNNEINDIFELRKRIGILSDNFYEVFSLDITGTELVLSGFFASTAVFSIHKVSIEMKKKALRIIDFLELSHIAERALETMSSGEINRFFLARTIVNDPAILILDEPTANLDMKSADKFLSYIEKLSKTTTIVIVTHNLSDITPSIKKVIMLKHGSIFFSGKKDDGLKSNIISKLFNYKINVIKKNKYYYAIKK